MMIYRIVLAFIVFNFVLSCNSDEAISITDVEDVEVDNPDPNDPEDLITATDVCLYDDLGIESGKEISINCLVDLGGQRVNVPSGVTFNFDGGDIFNGTLNFESSGEIDGILLNSTLGIEGDVSLISEEFEFYPSRWSIVEVINSNNPEPPLLEEAYNNHLMIQGTLDFVKSIGASTFSIGEMDAFFDSVNELTTAVAIANGVLTIPSDFNLKMSNDTFIRAFPASGGTNSSLLIKILEGSNINISGGNLIGNRLLRKSSFEGKAMGLRILGGQNIVVDNINISFTDDSGFAIQSSSFISRPEFFQSQNITLKNSTFDSNAKNNIQVTDGVDIIIENNISYRSGIDVESDFGLAGGLQPRIGILIETQELQFVEGVIIRNNIVEETDGINSILAVGATDIIIQGNKADETIGWTTAKEVQILNNTSRRISGGRDDDNIIFRGVDNIISGNTVSNNIDGAGIFVTNHDVQIFDNTILNCKNSIQLNNLTDARIYNNTITSNVDDSIGIIGQNALNNVIFEENSIKLDTGKCINITSINDGEGEEDYFFTFNNNDITATENGLTPGSFNIIISGNEFEGAGLSLSNANNIEVTDNNLVNAGDFVTFSINDSENIEVIGNTIEATNDGPFSTAVTIDSSSNSNIIFHNNIVKSLGINFGMNVEASNISIQNNTIQNESTLRPALSFSGDNSEIINNEFINTNEINPTFIIEGNNNTVSGNN